MNWIRSGDGPIPEPVPEDNVEFELTLEPGIDPIEMVRADGIIRQPENWKFEEGEVVKTHITRNYVHLDLGYCPNAADAETRADRIGYILADGRLRTTYRAKFPKPTRLIAVIFGGKSRLVTPRQDRGVPYLDGLGEAWNSYFDWIDHSFSERCRWVAYRKPAETK